METSQKFSLNTLDRKKIGKGALIAIAGALFTYLESVITTIDFGTYAPIVMAINSILVNIVTKWLQWNK